jgi:hypothetical protein
MNKTIWKPKKEINQMLRDYSTIGIISCGTCANLSYTGGNTGIRTIKTHMESIHKHIKMAKVILACCPEEIMRQALKTNKKVLSKCDALVVLSCAGGIKSANSCKPGLPVINLLDSVGSTAVNCGDPIIARSLCKSCGHCVLTFTAGICPLSECPAKSKYGPCKQFSESNTQCALRPESNCIWHTIRARSTMLHLLPSLKELHAVNEVRDMEWLPDKKSAGFWKVFFAWHAAHIQKLEWVVRLFR